MADNIAAYIKRRRQEERLTQNDISARLTQAGYKRAVGTIANWETGRTRIPEDILPPLALALNERSPNKLLELSGVLGRMRGAEVLRLLNGMSDSDIQFVEQMVKAYIENRR